MGACLSDTKTNAENDDSQEIQSTNCSVTEVADQLALLQLSLDNSTKAYKESKKRLHKRNESGIYASRRLLRRCATR